MLEMADGIMISIRRVGLQNSTSLMHWVRCTLGLTPLLILQELLEGAFLLFVLLKFHISWVRIKRKSENSLGHQTVLLHKSSVPLIILE